MPEPKKINPNKLPQSWLEDFSLERGQLLQILDAQFGFVVILNLDGTILEINETPLQLMGLPRQELVGRIFWNVSWFDSAAASYVKTLFTQALQGEIARGEVIANFPNYPNRVIAGSFTPLRNPDGQVIKIATTGIDITEQKQLEERFQTQEKALMAATNGIVITNLTGEIHWINTGFTRLTGYSAQEAVGRNMRFLKSGAHDGEFYRKLWSAITAGQIWHGELVNKHKLGHLYDEEMTITPIRSAQGVITNFIGIKQNITERKQFVRSLQDSQQQNKLLAAQRKAILESATGIIIFALNRSYRYTEFTHSHQETMRQLWKQEIAIGVNILEVIMDPADRAKAKANFDRVLQGEQLQLEEEYGDPSSKRAYYENRYNPIYDAAGAVIGLTVFVIDITTQKQLEAELWTSRQQMLQQEKLRSLGQMAAGIAHDFNNALSPIVGFSELLLKHPEKRANATQAEKWLRNIHTCATDAAKIIRQMREFGREQINPEVQTSIDINQLILQTLEFTKPSWRTQSEATGQTIDITTEFAALPTVAGEEFALRELFTNLIFNAIDAMPAGGTITVKTTAEENFIYVQVLDTGTGMTEEIRQRCLDPFFTTKGEKGTGLGLALVNRIVQRHNGQLDIQSAPGCGTTISIRLPISAGTSAESPLTVSAALSQPLSILAVDDQSEVLEVLEEYLHEDGHQTTAVASGAAALTEIESKKFDLVITDKAMPEMNGTQLATEIHQCAPELPVILLTGFGDLMKASGEMPPHIQLILSKPVDRVTLRNALVKVCPPK